MFHCFERNTESEPGTAIVRPQGYGLLIGLDGIGMTAGTLVERGQETLVVNIIDRARIGGFQQGQRARLLPGVDVQAREQAVKHQMTRAVRNPRFQLLTRLIARAALQQHTHQQFARRRVTGILAEGGAQLRFRLIGPTLLHERCRLAIRRVGNFARRGWFHDLFHLAGTGHGHRRHGGNRIWRGDRAEGRAREIARLRTQGSIHRCRRRHRHQRFCAHWRFDRRWLGGRQVWFCGDYGCRRI